jgi:hypothetical protein
MRFLQIEWHNHERARNAWDIERAEMKAKIAKQEGEGRQAKRLNEQLDRQVRMLEMALRNERAKSKGGKVEEKKGADPGKEKKKNGDEKGTKAQKRARKLSVRPVWKIIKLTISCSTQQASQFILTDQRGPRKREGARAVPRQHHKVPQELHERDSVPSDATTTPATSTDTSKRQLYWTP